MEKSDKNKRTKLNVEKKEKVEKVVEAVSLTENKKDENPVKESKDVTQVPKPEYAKYNVLSKQDGTLFLIRLNTAQLEEAEKMIQPYNKTYKITGGVDYNVEYKLSRPDVIRSQKQLKKLLDDDSKYYQHFENNAKL